MTYLISRRQLIEKTTAVSGLLYYGGIARSLNSDSESSRFIDRPDISSIQNRAVEVAIDAGADYADVRITFTRTRSIESNYSIHDLEDIVIGVRALKNGYWGFSGGPLLNTVEAERLGKEAVKQSLSSAASGIPGDANLSYQVPLISNGRWDMPVKIDPFEVSPAELCDYMNGLVVYTNNLSECRLAATGGVFKVQDKAYLNSEESNFVQRTYNTQGIFELEWQPNSHVVTRLRIEGLSPAGVGFELFDEDRVRSLIHETVEEARFDYSLPVKPVDVGRFETVLDADTFAQILSRSAGLATELDRALGYESNAGGTSYLSEPAVMIDNEIVASQDISITADRSSPGGCANVKWDDEGVESKVINLVEKGRLVNYQSNREGASWLSEHRVHGSAAASTGNSYAPTAVDLPMTHSGNITIKPAEADGDYADLIANVEKGVAFRRGGVSMDFQLLSGLAFGKCYEIREGRRTALLPNAGILFRAPEFMKSITAVGGENSRRRIGIKNTKGEPPQESVHSIYSVPVHLGEQAIVDIIRKG